MYSWFRQCDVTGDVIMMQLRHKWCHYDATLAIFSFCW